MPGHGWWHFGGMWFWWIFILIAIVAVVWALSSATRRPGGPGGETAEEVLKRRYANGEIDEETYQKKMKQLQT